MVPSWRSLDGSSKPTLGQVISLPWSQTSTQQGGSVSQLSFGGFNVLTLMDDDLSHGQAHGWHTDTHTCTHTHTHTQAKMTISGGQDWPRVKINQGDIEFPWSVDISWVSYGMSWSDCIVQSMWLNHDLTWYNIEYSNAMTNVEHRSDFNSLAPGRPGCHVKTAIFNLLLLIGIFTSSNDYALRWMPWDLTNDKSTLVQVMAWCSQATSHYLSQCWPRSMSPYGVTRPQWVKSH